MSNKSELLKSGLSSILDRKEKTDVSPDIEQAAEELKEKRKVGRPISVIREGDLKEGLVRATFIVHRSQVDSIKAIAYWSRSSIKDIIGEALSDYIAKYEKKNGKVEPIKK
jgi:hypothetical protein